MKNKPCPFCASTDIITINRTEPRHTIEGLSKIEIRCANCTANFVVFGTVSMPRTEQFARAHWNRRTRK